MAIQCPSVSRIPFIEQIISTTPQFYDVSVNSFPYTFYWTNQSSGAVWKSRWTSWVPVTNKPTVSVDVKQRFNQLNILSRRHQFYAVSVNSFRYTFYWTNYLDDTSFTALCERFSIYLLLNKLSRRHQFYGVSVNSFRYTFYWTNYLDDTSFTPSLWTVFDIRFTEHIISTTPVLRRLCEQFSIYLLLNILSRRHQFYAVSVNSFRTPIAASKGR